VASRGAAAANGTAQVAFLRGINVARNNRISMARLKDLVLGLGYADVRTHLQSGNVLYRTTASPARAAAAIERAVESELDLSVPVVARTRDQVAAAVDADPLGPVVTDPSRYLVVFLDRAATDAAVTRLAASVGPDERVEVVGREVYAWLPHGIHASKVGAALGRDVLGGVTWTGRNWRTVTAVLALLDQRS
jgi:uncharacterized protein (DUF1697 family)